MPGIVGIVAQGPEKEHQRHLDAMIRAMMHEPFYVSGTRSDPDQGVYSGWVAHAGSYAARQSTISDRDGLSLAFAGECFPDVTRGRPVAADVNLLDQYARAGTAFVTSLNGLFSGFLIDRKQRRAVLFNDRYSGERIYFVETRGALYFASEAKALLAVVPETRHLDDAGVAQLLAYGSTYAGQTLFRNVSLVTGASAWTFEAGRHAVKRQYFEPGEWEVLPRLADEDFERQFVDVAREVLPAYAHSEDTVGISITGGLDTRMIMACLPQKHRGLVCYTFGASNGETLDVRIGRRVSQSVGLKHHTLRVTDEFLGNFAGYVDRTVLLTDGTAGALSSHEILLNRMARALSPIRLTGNFGSEILRSATTLKPRRLATGLIDSAFRPLLDHAMAREVAANPVTQAAFREVPMHLFGSMAAARSQLTFRTPYLDNALVGSAYRASEAARSSPKAALRLIRSASPALTAIPTDRGVVLGERSLSSAFRRLFCEVTFKLDYMDKEGLSGVLTRFAPLFGALSIVGLMGLHKFLPWRSWLQNDLAEYVADVLATSRTQSLPYWNRSFLRTLAQRHALGQENYVQEIGAVLTIEAVQRVLLERWKSYGTPVSSGLSA